MSSTKNPVGLVWHSMFVAHDSGPGHPESSQRLIAIREAINKNSLWERFFHVEVREATREELLLNHTPELIEKVEKSAGKSSTFFDPDTIASTHTAEAAKLAVGGLIELAFKVADGELSRGFALVRPPGHHAERPRAMGFCYFNNVAIAARALLREGKVKKLAIVDFDVHHGNGTQKSFYSDPDVLFISLHQYPFYPGTGSLSEVGTGEGEGFNINIPLPGSMDDNSYAYCFKKLLEPIVYQFAPDMFLISAGYDAHIRDPLGGMSVTTGGFAMMMGELCRWADELAEGKIVATLEGGYDLKGLSESVVASLRILLGDEVERSGNWERAGRWVRDVGEKFIKTYSKYWNFSDKN